MIKFNDGNYERIIFINNDIKKLMYVFYRKIEEAKSMIHL